jgi:hypothetical protein
MSARRFYLSVLLIGLLGVSNLCHAKADPRAPQWGLTGKGVAVYSAARGPEIFHRKAVKSRAGIKSPERFSAFIENKRRLGKIPLSGLGKNNEIEMIALML